MFECYLLIPRAIAAVLGEELGRTVPVESVENDMVKQLHGKVTAEADAAHILDTIFWELSGQTLQYSKVRHGTKLTEWLVAHDPSALAELTELLRTRLVPTAGRARMRST